MRARRISPSRSRRSPSLRTLSARSSAGLHAFDVTTLIIHGDDDQIVPIQATATRSAEIVRGSVLKTYEGAPHGLATTHKDRLNADLLSFIRG